MSKTLPRLKHPTYTTILPISKQRVQYRPFTVSEEKSILLSAEGDDSIENLVAATWNLVNACCDNKLSKYTLPSADFEWLLMQIRAKSVGEVVDGTVKCEACGEKGKVDLNLTNLKVEGEWKTKDITVQPGYIITVGMPTVHSILEVADMYAGRDSKLLATCIEKVTVDNEVYKHEDVELVEFIAMIDDLPLAMFTKIVDFISTCPKISYVDKYVCKSCGHEQEINVEGFENFFEYASAI